MDRILSSLYYSRIIAVTDRHAFDSAPEPEEAFLLRLEELSGLGLKAVVLREKDMEQQAYRRLAEKVLAIDERTGRNWFREHLILHYFPETARELELPRIHLPLPLFRELSETKPELLSYFRRIGTSVHSRQEAEEAERCGASYCFAGNVYETVCKPGLEARGLPWLKTISESVRIPVYAIGGVCPERMPEILKAGAAGGCMRSGLMTPT